MPNNNHTPIGENITHILFASQTGNAEGVAYDLGAKIGGKVMDMADVSTDDFKSFQNVIIVTSTHGEGDHPDNGQLLWDQMQNVERVYCNFAVLGLGDTSYEYFCKPSENWDTLLENLGGSRKMELVKLDVDFEQHAEIWIEKVKQIFGVLSTSDPILKKPNESIENNTKILFASQTGNAEGVAYDLATKIGGKVMDMADVSTDDFKSFQNVVIVTSTHGEGDHPDNGQLLWDQMQNVERVYCNFAVLGLGDTSYEYFCKPSENWDTLLENLGGSRKMELVKLDVDFEQHAEIWIEKVKQVFGKLGVFASQNMHSIKNTLIIDNNKSIYNKGNPFMASLLNNTLLSKKDSDKQIHHFEFDTRDPEMAYEVGDALGVIPFNSEKLVMQVLKAGGFDGTTMIGDKTLSEVLTQDLEIRIPNKDFMTAVAKKSNNTKLQQIIIDKQAMHDYLWGREVTDFLNDYDADFREQEFVNVMKPLQHRLYSICSSPKAHPAEIHITVRAVKYDFNGRPCEGVASCFLADYVHVSEKVGIFIQPNKAFSIPADDTVPMIMVGPGTGIAPFRGFIHERIARGATGQNWLFFGDRTQQDYLYQDKLENWVKYGKIKLSLAWSRGKNIPKTYVQDVMKKEGKALFDALEQGGYFFVCGDALRMAPDVESALLEIIAINGEMSVQKATDYLNNLKRNKRYVRDVY